jgi:threonine dehydrogenase-like Zn-dependent dehydrogenase
MHMRAVTWQGMRRVSVERVPDPVIREPSDAIIRITSTNICGSDLHVYAVLAPFLDRGDILGHEAMGIVEEAGPAARPHVSPGDRVAIPFTISCGRCWMCERALYAQCDTTQNTAQGTGAALFGYSKLYGHVPGAQAEYLRVPQAQFGPIKVPDGPPDDRFVYLSDILPTAWQAARYADIPAGGTAAVYGLGSVGQFASRILLLLGAERVFGVDLVPERLAMATRHGVEAIDASEVDDVPGYIKDQTGGRGPHGVIDAVGMTAHGNRVTRLGQNAAASMPRRLGRKIARGVSVDSTKALRNAIDTVCRGGTVSISGVYGGAIDPLPMMAMFDKGVQLRMGQCHVKRWVDEIMPYLEDPGDPLATEDMASHYLPLEDAPHGYELFETKAEGCTKVVLQPDRVSPEVFPGGAGPTEKAAARLNQTAVSSGHPRVAQR